MEFYSTLAPIIFSEDLTKVPDFLVEHKLLADSANCPNCKEPMVLRGRPKEDTSDGYGWCCINQRCSKLHAYHSIRTGSFFYKSRLPLAKWVYFFYLWAQETDQEGSWIDWCIRKDSCPSFPVLQRCLQHKTTAYPKLGGPGVILQIDESLFCHKANDNRGRRASKEQWVFGIADTSYKPAITYMEVVQKHDADTLLPIIERIACPGSIIHSDQWRVYHSIHQRLQLDHGTVNHSLNFVDPETGVHTQAIESYWAKAKQKFKTMKGVSADALPTYLDGRMWRDRPQKQHLKISAHIAEQYKKSDILTIQSDILLQCDFRTCTCIC